MLTGGDRSLEHVTPDRKGHHRRHHFERLCAGAIVGSRAGFWNHHHHQTAYELRDPAGVHPSTTTTMSQCANVPEAPILQIVP